MSTGVEKAESPELLVLRQGSEWRAAVEALRAALATGGDRARRAAAGYSEVYAGRRGGMVFDVVASRQRNYKGRVLPLVERWSDAVGEPSLAQMASQPPRAADFGLLRTEPDTMRTVAANLMTFSSDLRLSEDEGCRTWAEGVQGLEHAHDLDPVVGGVPGIGPALFAYMRMRSGGNTLKPDVRVAKALRRLGFRLPGDVHSILVTARAAATEIDVDMLTLDQLLWASED